MVLDLAAQHRVGPLPSGQDILELVEHDQGPGAVLLVQPSRQGQAFEQWPLVLRVDGRYFDTRRDRATAGAQSGTQEPASAREPQGHPPLELRGIRLLDPGRDVVEGEHAEEVHVHRRPALVLCIAHEPMQQGRLAVAARCHEPAVVAVEGISEQRRGLTLPVDEVLRQDRAAVRKGIHALYLRADSLSVVEHGQVHSATGAETIG